MDLAKTKALLMKQEGGSSLYEHLVQLMLKVVVEQPDNALSNFEALSAGLRAKSFPDGSAGGGGGGGGRRVLRRARCADCRPWCRERRC